MRIAIASLSFALCFAIIGCDKKSEPVPPPTAEEIDAFVEAAFSGNTAAVSSALEKDMPADQKDANGNSALMAAAFNGQVESMKVLIDAGADVNLRINQGVTPLMAACGPYPAAVRLLLENGAEVNATDEIESFTALMYAAVEGLSPIVDILLEYGADPAMVDVDNDTAGNFARQRGFIALADKLQALVDQKKAE
ncbi:MAG: ankyrin repeat domain-containing protein [Kiritimatiellales bacterium]|nr:ankyrin repeat domain-containing protein [Kiritimatiellales bacterium]